MREQQEHVRAAYDKMADVYDQGYSEEARYLAENAVLLAWTKPYVNGHGTVVDVGCGTGLLLDLHDGEIGPYIGFDLSHGMLEVARHKHPERDFRQGDMEELWPVEPGRADAVISLFAFCYSLCPTFTVEQMAAALRPGGKFFVILFGKRWPRRHTFAEGMDGSGGKRVMYTAESARLLFDTPDFCEVRIRGLSRLVDHAPKRSMKVAHTVLRAETATLLRAIPDLAYYLIVEGTRI